MNNGWRLKMKINLPHIKSYTAKGKTYYYHRRTGKRIEGEPGSLTFIQSYENAKKFYDNKQETFKDLMIDYFQSRSFAKLAVRTRDLYLSHKKYFEEKWSSLPVAVLKDQKIKKHFRKWRDELAVKHGDRTADLVFATVRRIVSFAVGDGILPINHLLTIEGIYSTDRSDIIWLPEHVEAFMNSGANQTMQLALIIGLNIGRREADIIRLTWSDFKGDCIMVTNRKSGKTSKFPARCTPILKETLEQYRLALKRVPRHDETILTTIKGMPWTEKHFSTKFSAAKNRAGLIELHYHDLRGTAVTVLSEAGATPQEIASITGHSLKYIHAILEKYMATTRQLNVAATKKLSETWIASIRMG